MKEEIKIVALSDTHTLHRQIKSVPDGDVLVFAGDLMNWGTEDKEIADFANWFMHQPHKYKVLVAGNHDRLFEKYTGHCLSFFEQWGTKGFHYLQDSGIVIKGWKFWGSPYQPEFCNWAFNCQRGFEIRQHWDKIPLDTDILITHGPPLGIGDTMGATYEEGKWNGSHVGDADLLVKMREVNPELHIFGHVHSGRGLYPPHPTDQLDFKEGYKTCCMNVAICDEAYKPVHEPITMWLAERE